MKKITILLTFFAVVGLGAQQTPAPSQQASILIKNAILHIGNGQTFSEAYLGFDSGKINYVGTAKPVATYDQEIDAQGQHVYPGFIAVNATLGLVEVDAVRASDDEDEIGDFLPHIRSAIAYNAESKLVESMRPNGILVAQVTPRGGTISGSSSVMQLDAWNWEDALLKTDEGIHLNWPSPYSRGRWWMGEDPGLKPNKSYAEDVEKLNTFFEASKAYLPMPSPVNLPYEAMRKVFEGTKTVYLHADDEKQIVEGIQFLKRQGISKIVLVGGQEATHQLDLLKEHNVPVVVSHPHRLPSSDEEDPKWPFKLADKLVKAGLLVSIDVSGRQERMNTRNLPFYAGSFAAYGLGTEEALQLITKNAAKILGVDDQMGTLEVGKDATLFVSKGDALDMRTNILSAAFIQGRTISLETHQTRLWKRYSKKFAGQ